MTRIAVAQTCSSDNIQQNVDSALDLIASAADQGAIAIYLPECFALMQTSRKQLRESAEVFEQGVIQKSIEAAARRYRIMVFAGTIPIRSADPERVFNSSLVYSAKGELVARYDKIHLFDVRLESGEKYLESAYTVAGDRLAVVNTPVGKIGLSVCYDLRFPELYRELVNAGAEILLVPSAFSVTTGRAHWQCLLRARAIENFCYVIAAAQSGKHSGGRSTYGHSIVIDPWGRIVAEKKSGTGLVMADIDLNEVVRARRQLPSLNHRRRVTRFSDEIQEHA